MTAKSTPAAAPKPAEPQPPEKGPFGSRYRTHTCGELRKADVGREVQLAGAVDRKLDARTLELRDGYGRTLVRLNDSGARCVEVQLVETKELPLESVIMVLGHVRPREAADAALPTGEVFVEAYGVMMLAQAKAPIVYDFHDAAIAPRERVRHRYVYLRKPEVHETFAFRTRLQAEARRFLLERAFVEVETPILGNRYTPDNADTYFAIRGRNQVFALPGRRPVQGPLLMASGFDRTFEVARRFRRRRAYGPLQQPEFTVLELMMAFVQEKDLTGLAEQLLAHLWKALLGEELKLPVPRIPYEDAWNQFGTDAPDVRFSLVWKDMTQPAAQAKEPRIRDALLAGGAVRAVLVPQAAAKLEAALPELDRLAAERKGSALFAVQVGAEGAAARLGPESWPFDAGLAGDVARALNARPKDLAVVAFARDRASAGLLGASVRLWLARALKLDLEKKHGVALVTKLPYHKYDAAARRWVVAGDPLAKPVEGDLEGDPTRMRAQAFEVVVNGHEVGNGAVRNHAIEAQQKLFAQLGMTPGEVDARFGQVLRAGRYGMPPHGRIALGVDRLVAILRGLDSIAETIPLPKLPDGTDPLTRSPWPIEPAMVKGLFGL
ncbi:MAG TPA: amino acid--tRNA ligase-related protein [Planctomycetota bacterium]|nr:amino acid--tRNA ligase-related protein [Planctomycetota bacterium]